MVKQVYCIFSNGTLFSVCSSKKKLIAVISSGIQKEIFRYGNGTISFQKQAMKFRKDCNAIDDVDGILATIQKVKHVSVRAMPLNVNPFLS